MKRLRGLPRSVHGWAGAILALYVLVIGLSGTLLLWKQAYLKMTIPEARVQFTPTPMALAAIAADIEARFVDREILQIQFPTEDFALAKVIFPETH